MPGRAFCATCVHIEHVRDDRGQGWFRCRRLGWRTHPRWSFRCWTPRPPKTRMPDRSVSEQRGQE